MSDLKGNLAKAIIAVMKEVKGVEKNTTVGTGNSSYKGVKDQDVKQVVQAAMAKHGLCILPISIDANTKIKRWEQEEFWNGQSKGIKQKQNVFTEITTKYLLMHESGESMEVVGIGHANDPSDKAAGKATTYALKNALLYTFLIPTGDIDDTDSVHSKEQEVPPSKDKQAQKQQKQQQHPAASQLPVLKEGSAEWKQIEHFNKNGKLTSLSQITKKFTVNEVLQAKIVKMIKDRTDQNEGAKPNLDAETYKSAMRMKKPEKVQAIIDGYEMTDDARKGLENKLAKLKGEQ